MHLCFEKERSLIYKHLVSLGFCFCFSYINPFWLVLATNLASALYAYLFVRESVHPDPSARLLTTRHHKAVWHLYSTGGGGGGLLHRRKLWLYTLCFFLVVGVHFGTRELYVLYELSSPLCWDSALIGYGSAAQNLAYLSSLLGLKVMQRCLQDSWVAVVGLASNITGLVVFSVADNTQLMFTGKKLQKVVKKKIIKVCVIKLVLENRKLGKRTNFWPAYLGISDQTGVEYTKTL